MSDDIETETVASPEPITDINPKDLLHTGSTLLNLILTGNPHGGFLCGKYFFLVGDSQSGKTFLCMTCLAEATINPAFNNYRFIYDNIEDGMLMNTDELFSEEVADRMEPPATLNNKPVFSDTVENFYYNLDDALFAAGWDSKKRKLTGDPNARPFIYILDSQDALDSEAATAKFHAHKAATRKRKGREAGEPTEGDGKDEKVAGSYGDGKAKKHSEGLRHAIKGLTKTGSILIIVSQTRDNLNPYEPKKTRSGGKSLKFYACCEVWSSVVQQITKDVNDIKRKVGVRVKLESKKNRITGVLAEAEIDIYPSFGIDDMGTCVDYLVEEGFWEKASGAQLIKANGLDMTATREKIIRRIEKGNLEDKVRGLCGKCWAQVQAACALKRKNRYAKREPE